MYKSGIFLFILYFYILYPFFDRNNIPTCCHFLWYAWMWRMVL